MFASRSINLAALLALAVPAGALAQDPGAPPTGAPVQVTVDAPQTVTKAALKKGLAVKVSCPSGCTARVSLAGPIGIITQRSVTVAPGATAKVTLKGQAFQVKALKKGAKLYVNAPATGADGGKGVATDTVKVR